MLEFICQDQPERWQTRYIRPNAEGSDLARMILNAYLSKDHFDDRDGSCPMIALPSDVARGNRVVKGAFKQVLEMMVGAFAANLEPEDGMSSRERGLALVALAVGGMVLARAVDDKALADEVRDSAHKQAFATTGWDAR